MIYYTEGMENEVITKLALKLRYNKKKYTNIIKTL
jgi:hypothetical protein